MEHNFAVTAAIIFADGLSDKEEKNMKEATKNYLEKSTKRFNIFIFKTQKAKIFDHNTTSYRSHNIRFFNFLKPTIQNCYNINVYYICCKTSANQYNNGF